MGDYIMENFKYILKKAQKKYFSLLEKWKLQTVLEYAGCLSIEELSKIKNFTHKSVKDNIQSYNLVVVNENNVGCFLVRLYKDGYLLDEIYLENAYRNQGIGTSIILDILKRYSNVYLWVYKKNHKAIRLYKRLGFNVLDKTETRYLMKFENMF